MYLNGLMIFEDLKKFHFKKNIAGELGGGLGMNNFPAVL